MKQLLIIFALCLCGYCASAQGYQWLTFSLTDGSKLSVPADNVTMTYEEGRLKVQTNAGSQTLNVSDLLTMTFTNDPAGVKEITEDLPDEFTVFTLEGKECGKFKSLDAVRDALSSGVYVVKSDRGNFKISF